jgi:hypothetical protein
MRIAMAVTAVLILGAGLGGCVAVDTVTTVAGAAGTVIGTAADVGGAVVGGTVSTVTGSSDDKDSSGN